MKRDNGSRKAKKDVKKINQSEMAGDLVSMFDDGTEKREETSFMDLPDDALIRIFKLLNFQTQSKLRLNKRLDWIHKLGVRNSVDKLQLDIYSRSWKLKLGDVRCESHDYIQLEKGLRRVAINTSIDRFILLIVHDNLNKQNACIIDELSNFKADFLHVGDKVAQGNGHLPQVNLSTLLTIAQNVREVTFFIDCPSLSAQDLCALRKVMLEGGCKLNYFRVRVDDEMVKSFRAACFGITVEEVTKPHHGKIYSATDESVEIYSTSPDKFDKILHHTEGNLETTLTVRFLIFRKDGIKMFMTDKLQFNHLYPTE